MERNRATIILGGVGLGCLAVFLLVSGMRGAPVSASAGAQTDGSPTPASTEIAARERGDAATCIKVEDLQWQNNELLGSATNHCDHEINAAEIDLQMVKDNYINESLMAFGSHIPPNASFDIDVHTRRASFDADGLKPFVAAVRED